MNTYRNRYEQLLEPGHTYTENYLENYRMEKLNNNMEALNQNLEYVINELEPRNENDDYLL